MDGDKPESSSSSDGSSSSSSSEESGSSDSEEACLWDAQANGKKPCNDEAASNPASSDDDGARPSTALSRPSVPEKSGEPPERQAPTAKPERPKKKLKRHREALPEFELTVDTLQGRWRHSVSSLGMLTVRGSTVQFDLGNVYELEEIVPGRIEMRGWQTVQQRSCAEEIVWMNRERTQEVRWMLEEDADQPSLLDGLDKRNIIKGKRKRNKVDYRAVEREIEAEERRHKDVFSDGSNESHGEEAIETMTPKEWSAMHASQCAKATKLFHQWMLLTCTPRHEEILKRKGKLITRLSVSLVGPGQLMLKKGLQSYGIALHFHAQETTVVVDAAARQRYQERHAAEWQAARVKLASRAQAAAALREGQAPLKPPLAEPMAAQEAEATTAEPPAKRKRLRRIVDSDDEAPTPSTSKEADEAAAGEPTESIRPPQNGTVTAAPEMPSEVAPTEAVMAMPTEDVAKPAAEEAEMPLEKVVEKVKMELEVTPPPSAAKASELLSFLETQRVSPEIMLSTKIGVTVTGMRKTYAGHSTLALRAKNLVQRWKTEYFDKEKGFRA